MAEGRHDQTRSREFRSASKSLLKIFRRALVDGVTRDGWLAVEGPLLLEEALNAYARGTNPGGTSLGGFPDNAGRIHSVLVARSAEQRFPQLLERLPEETEVAYVSDHLFQQLAQTKTPQGVAALVELRTHDLDAVLAQSDVVLLVACGLQDPGNLGTVMRSAQALGAAALLTLKATVSPFNPKAVRSSAGAIFSLPVFRDQEPGVLFARLRQKRVRIIAADRRSPSTLVQADLRGSVAFLVGQEARGLKEEIVRQANRCLSIPIRPGTDSINAATAASIFLYEAARQRGFNYGVIERLGP